MCIRDRYMGTLILNLKRQMINPASAASGFSCSFPCCCCKMGASETAKTIIIVDLITMIFLFFGAPLLLVLPYLIISGIALYKIQHHQVHWSRRWAPSFRIGTWTLWIGLSIFYVVIGYVGMTYGPRDLQSQMSFSMIFLSGLLLLPISILQLFVSLIFRRAMNQMETEVYQATANVVVGIPVHMTPNAFTAPSNQDLFDQSNTDKGTNHLVSSF
eukprot:TRINITY_DN7809_c0_g1_i1.p1 TRINITY_DN7809_c0_g1~~TRINITY_DN7809_c0_g1_i1.p1  ORF type:complete len:215 (+),score=2.32 TRINITY_DN7809_c0_g1_i1:65-709(+)